MSARRRRLVLGPRAKQDFSDILLYTVQQWGKEQRTAYKAAIDHALRDIARFPGLGRSREDLRPGLRSHQVRQHVIYYRLEPDAIRVDRILHAEMDAVRHLEE